MNAKMKTRLISLLLCLVMVVGMMPTTVMAEEGCTHINAVYTPACEATCFEPGTQAYWFCEDCWQYLSEDKTTVLEPDYETTFDELQVISVPATGHSYDNGVCVNCDMPVPVYSKVTSLADINEEDLYIFVAEFEGEESKKYFVFGGLMELGYENHLVCGADVSNAIGVTPNADGTITLANQPSVFGVTAAEFMFDVNPEYHDLTDMGLTTVMPLLPNHCLWSFQSYSFEDTGVIATGRYAGNNYSQWDSSPWVIDFYTTEVNEDTYQYEDEFGTQTHAEQVAEGHIGENVSEGNLLMYPEHYISAGGAMFTLRFRIYDSNYYFIAGEDGFLEGVTQEVEYGPISTNDTQYAINLYRYDVPTVDTHTCEFGDWVDDEVAETHTRTCTDPKCGKTETTAHIWNNGEETKAPTCIEAGVKTYTCTANCGATKTEPVSELDHDWSDWTDDGANATTDTHTHSCQREGCNETEQVTHSWSVWLPDGDTNHKKTCSICNGTRTDAHKWDGGVITKQPTEDEEGAKTYTCSDCGNTKTEAIDKLEHVHNWSNWGQNDETTHIRSCRCNETQTEAHNFDDGVVINWATHLAPGEIHFTCTDCGYVKIDTQPALEDHEWGDWTCNNDGKTHTRSCICNEAETKDCTWDAGVVNKQPTHYEEGVKTYTCFACLGIKTESIPKTTAHEWADWVGNNDGRTHTHECKCSATETLAHTWGTWAEQDAGGYKRECADCGATEWMILDEEKPVNTTPTDNAANTNLINTDIELIDKVLTDEEQSQIAEGAEVKIYLIVEDISNEVSDDDKAATEDKAGDNEIGMYLDIDLFKQVGTNETQVKETAGGVTITVMIPENLINNDASVTRTYKIIRVHEDENGSLITDIIEGIFNPEDNSFTFQTDKFSTYALVYADSKVDNTPSDPDDSSTDDDSVNDAPDTYDTQDSISLRNSPPTGDSSMMWIWVVLLFVSVFSAMGITVYSKKKIFAN